MTHPLSALGVLHTAISLIPVFAGLYGFVRHRKIDPATGAGKLYLVGWCSLWRPRSPSPAPVASIPATPSASWCCWWRSAACW